MRLTRAGVFSAAIAAGILATPLGASQAVSTILGTGVPGYSDAQVNNPYGLVFGPDGALYFCDLDNQRIRRFDPKTKAVTTIAGNGEKGYNGDGGPATQAALNMPHEIQFDQAGHLYIAERDNHVIRKVDAKSGIISTVAGTGRPGLRRRRRARREGAAASAAQHRARSRRHAADLRHRQPADPAAASRHRHHRDLRRHRRGRPTRPTARRSAARRCAARGRWRLPPIGDLYLALREGNAILRIDRRTQTLHRIAGTGEQGYAGDGGPALNAKLGGPKGLAYRPGRALRRRYREPRHPPHRSDEPADHDGARHRRQGRRPGDHRRWQCKLSRPHGVLADPSGALYVADSEAHRIRRLN